MGLTNDCYRRKGAPISSIEDDTPTLTETNIMNVTFVLMRESKGLGSDTRHPFAYNTSQLGEYIFGALPRSFQDLETVVGGIDEMKS